MSSLYVGRDPARLPVGIIKEIVGSRKDFPLNHATESFTISQFREPVKYKFDSTFSKGIMGGEYVDLYSFSMNVPDLLLSIERMKNWYLASKDLLNLRAKVTYRNKPSRWLNFVDDTGDPSQDGSTENGSSLVSLVPTFTIDNTTNKTELDFFGGLTPGEMIWLADHSTAASTGGTGGTGSSMTAMVNSRIDRPISGIRKLVIRGQELNIITKENSKFVMKGVVPGDRKSYNDQQFVNSYLMTATIEVMGVYPDDELKQAIIDEISATASGIQPAFEIHCQGAPNNEPLIIAGEAGTATFRPTVEGGDDMGHMTMNVSYEAQFNDDEASPNSMDFGDSVPGTLLFKALF